MAGEPRRSRAHARTSSPEAPGTLVSETTLSLTVAILRAAHCRSTHHYFAVDALPLVRSAAGRRLVGHLVRHHQRYLSGAKDPDSRFRDFQNHVVHVGDGYWGGAPRVAHQWYDRLQRYLASGRYSDAAHAAGVLSHYFTDPIQPLHTAQTELEQVLHRPIEWSITKTYTQLRNAWQQEPDRVLFQLSDQPGWLGDAIRQAAKVAHRQYPLLLEQYDLVAGRSDPPAGLNALLRDRLSELVGLAITGWARVIERAAWEAERRTDTPISPARPAVGLVLAGIRVPTRWWLRRIHDAAEQQAVEALVMEFQQNGCLTEHLPDEQRILAKVRQIREREKEFAKRRSLQHELLSSSVDHTDESSATGVDPSADSASGEEVSTPAILPFRSAVSAAPGAPRPRLTLSDPLVEAPSIGPKTAARFAAIGMHTIGDFLTGEVAVTADRLNTRWITVDTLHAWRCQTMLMCQLPDMLVREAQLLVGAGYRTADTIARADATALHKDVARYASGYQGRRHLRGAEPPTFDRIQEVVGEAALAMVQQKRGLSKPDKAADEPLAKTADRENADPRRHASTVAEADLARPIERPEDQAAA